MATIDHRVGIKTSPAELYEALTTDAGLARWWTADTTGAGAVGSTIRFGFGGSAVKFAVTGLESNERVQWRCTESPAEPWLGSEITFHIQPADGQTFLRFTHDKWPERSDFMAHCSIKWATFLMSLKAALETGSGAPYPNDVPVDHC